MAEFYATNDSIESSASEIFSRKIIFKSVLKYDKIGNVVTYKTDRNASACITSELPNKGNKDLLYDKNSHTDLGDKLKADAISFAHSGIRKLQFSVSEGASATHGGQFLSTSTYTFAKITQPFSHIASAIENRKRKELGL